MRVVLMAFETWGCYSLRALLQTQHEIPLVVTHPDPAIDQPTFWDGSVRELAEANNIPVIVTKQSRDPDLIQRIADAQPDVVLSSNWQTLVVPEILALPRVASLNIHDAPLPRYAGFGPANWSIINDETETAVTVHFMDEQFDTGDILIQRKVPITFTDTATDIDHKNVGLFADLAVEALDLLESGAYTPIKQDLSKATFYHRRLERDSRIDWAQPPRTVYNLIRAGSDPYYNAHTTFHGEKLKIKQATLPADKNYCGTPGRIFRRVESGVVVVCGRDGLSLNQGIIIEQVQLEGGEALEAQEFFRGAVGEYLGEQ